MPYITALYVGITGLMLFAMSFRVSMLRLKPAGQVHEKHLENAVRLQANFAEYAPMAMILILILELISAPAWMLHVFGAAFLIGRVLHMIGFSKRPQILPLRMLGMVFTYAMLMLAGLANIYYALF